MSLSLLIDTTCPKCRKPVKVRAIELHPARRSLAIQYFQCADCGDVEAKFISLKPLKPLQNLQRRGPSIPGRAPPAVFCSRLAAWRDHVEIPKRLLGMVHGLKKN